MTTVTDLQDVEILKLPISEKRRGRFLDSYLSDRSQTETLKPLFTRVGAFQALPEFDQKHRFGFNVLLKKEPFCDLPNWGEVSTWKFAVEAERYLLRKLMALLPDRDQPTRNRLTPDALVATLGGLAALGVDSGYSPSVLVITGQLAPEEVVELHESGGVTPQWGTGSELPGSHWVLGTHRGLPVLHLPQFETQRVYAIDLARFASLTKYDEVEYELAEIDETRARKILSRRQEDSNGQLITDEAILELRLQVNLQLFESYSIDLIDPEAAFTEV